MWQSERGYLINSATWSSYLSFVIFLGLAIVASIPDTGAIERVGGAEGGLTLLFPFVAILFFGILSMNFGQLELEWANQFGKTWSSYYRHLLAQIGFLALLMLPEWIVYQGAYHLPSSRLLWGGVHLFLYGLTAGLFGMLIGLRTHSEISQFNIKYAVFIAFDLLTAIWLQPLNPFITLFAIFGDAVLNSSDSVWFFLQSYLGFALLLSVLFWLTRRQISSLEEVLV
ncbi:hypothetical protein HYR54_14510 [Candidatus Acetothermia bacterium]|nr:hypothetical protein [Candidatus Acetothermia bacterium]